MPNIITVENARAGTSAWQLQNPAQAREIEGFCSVTSVDRGGSIDVKVNCASAYTLDVYRMGWYGGAGARHVTGPIARPAHVQPAPVLTNQSGVSGVAHQVLECLWSTSYTLTVPATDDWPSGIYLVRAVITEGANAGRDTYLIFCVRDDARTSGAGAAEVVYIQPVTTYHAYNPWGGKSLYDSQSENSSYPAYGIDHGFTGRAARVSLNRPYTTAPAAGVNPETYPGHERGMGAGQFFTPGGGSGYAIGTEGAGAGWEFETVLWLEREGYDVRYVTDVDLHTGAAALGSARAVISPGHDEYYSMEMRAAMLAARDAGVGLDILGANCAYWLIRYEESNDGTALRTLVCYKSTADPGSPDTRQFRQIGFPEAEWQGVQYVSYGVSEPMKVKAGRETHWVFEGTGVIAGQVIGEHLVGYEFDKWVSGVSHPSAAILCETTGFPNYSGSGSYSHHATIYQDVSGAWVFATGSMQFSWGLIAHPYLAPALRPDVTSPVVQRMFANVLAAQGVLPDPDPTPPKIIKYQVQERSGTSGTFVAIPGTQWLTETQVYRALANLPEGTWQFRIIARDEDDLEESAPSLVRTITIDHPTVVEPPPPPPPDPLPEPDVGVALTLDGYEFFVLADDPQTQINARSRLQIRRSFTGALRLVGIGNSAGSIKSKGLWPFTLWEVLPVKLALLESLLENRRMVIASGEAIGSKTKLVRGVIETRVVRCTDGVMRSRTRIRLEEV